MVLESLIDPKQARKNPWELFTLGFMYSSVGILLSMWVFSGYGISLSAVFLTTIACIPLLFNLLRVEERKEEGMFRRHRIVLIKDHQDIFLIFTFLFIGILTAYILWFVLLPSSVTNLLFFSQIDTIQKITGGITSQDALLVILMNNMKVLAFCLIFSFLFSAGAIFIITWNASVVAVAIGTLIRSSLSSITGATIGTYFHVIPLSIARYMTHGSFEIAAYFLGGIAGGIISAATMRHNIRSREFLRIVMDSLDLIILAAILLIFGAIIEVTVSPYIQV